MGSYGISWCLNVLFFKWWFFMVFLMLCFNGLLMELNVDVMD